MPCYTCLQKKLSRQNKPTWISFLKREGKNTSVIILWSLWKFTAKQLPHTVSFSSIFFTENNLNVQLELVVGEVLLAWNFLLKESERHHIS